MFYPVESLKRGGRFYLCWMADSWPVRFASVTRRQLWSQDIRRICGALMDVMNNESGRPANRFSLRLSSQLMRGLARLYQKKVNSFLSDLYMLNADVLQHANKKYYIPEVNEVARTRPRPQTEEQLQIILPEEPENDQRMVEIIQNSGNVVTDIQDITLKEATIPEFQLPPNDGFGEEENPEQILQLLADRTVEQMMQPTEPSHTSGIEPLDITDKSHDSRLDKSRLVLERQMERISEHDVTMFLKPNGEELIPGGDFEKDIQIPEIPDIPIPELPIPPQEPLPLEPEIVEATEPPRNVPAERPQVLEEIELEELEEREPQAKRRRFRKLIIDKKTKISANTLRARIDNINVELRCEDSSDDIIEIRVPCDVYMRRPCHAGGNINSKLSLDITRLFMRNLGMVYRSPRAEREFQEEIMHRQRPRTRSMLQQIEEVEEPLERPQIEAASQQNITHKEITLVQDLSKDYIEGQKEVDITEMLTQKIETLSQQARKRKTAEENVLTPKKQRSMGYVAFRESQQNLQTAMETTVQVTEPEPEIVLHMDKENVPQNMQDFSTQVRPSKELELSVTAMLQEAGLADIQTNQPEVTSELVMSQRKSPRRQGSRDSETPLGSLDRTKVSLGDSEQTTESQKFRRDHWGTVGTMIKILKFIRDGSSLVNVRTLISEGPVMSGYKALIAARCFASILKLKQHGFITIVKCPETLEIEDIELGPKFDSS